MRRGIAEIEMVEGQSLTRTREPLIAMLDGHRGERHAIVLQDFPDPDAIASALAHQLISREYEIQVDILYTGAVSHQQNLALVRLLGIDLIHHDPSLDLTRYDGAVFVDHQGTTSLELLRALERGGIPVLLIVDHHAPQSRVEPEFADIRKTGATSTIYSSYLQSGILELDSHNKDHVRTATALMHGILTDTGNFLHAKEEDFFAAAFLSRFIDTQVLKEILSQSRSKQTMEVIRRALEDRLIAEGFSIAPIGFLRETDRDAIPQAADFLLTEENVHTAIVYGIVSEEGQEERLIGSLRTLKLTLNVDTFLKDSLGKDSAGEYFGGGKEFAGGFAIPVGFLAGNPNDGFVELKWKLFDLQVKNKFLEKIGADPPGDRSKAGSQKLE
ncbi:MAG TPA: bifunctional oligoribonuclease/PAP phosphatase NrnA [Anaerolineales bacterium]|nr:bifunctional oligoribonuclease/PAP phosphatase NrnA [Anaerolineales bacterium]